MWVCLVLFLMVFRWLVDCFGSVGVCCCLRLLWCFLVGSFIGLLFCCWWFRLLVCGCGLFMVVCLIFIIGCCV